MDFRIFDLGLIGFKQAWDWQKEIFIKVKNGNFDSALILCQHYPVITLGRSADRKNILLSEEKLRDKGIEIYAIERGGDVTYHGPGQITVYPILNLNYFKKDIHWFLRELEKVIISFLSDFGINAQRHPALTGVWIDRQKIASIGIAIKNWITFHGLSINIKKDDLVNFRCIRPCGMNIEMTCLEIALSKEFEIDSLKENLISKFRDTLSANQGTPFEPIGGVSPFERIRPLGDTLSFSRKSVPVVGGER